MRTLETRIPPPVVMLITAVLMYLADRTWPLVSAGYDARWFLVVLLFACGLAVTIAGALAFRRSGTTLNPLHPDKASVLVMRGVFRRSRNPMYLGMLLMLCGWAAHLASAVGALGPVLFILYMNRFQIRPEEQILRAKFGPQWDAYASRVRRWL